MDVGLSAEQLRQVKEIFEVELPKALEALWDKKAPEMEQVIATRVYRNVRKPMQREHAENRVRLKALDTKAETAKEAALKAEANTAAVLDRINEHYEDGKATRSAVTALTERFGQFVGERDGKKDERERFHSWGSAIGKGVIALLSGGGIAEIVKRWHKH